MALEGLDQKGKDLIRKLFEQLDVYVQHHEQKGAEESSGFLFEELMILQALLQNSTAITQLVGIHYVHGVEIPDADSEFVLLILLELQEIVVQLLLDSINRLYLQHSLKIVALHVLLHLLQNPKKSNETLKPPEPQVFKPELENLLEALLLRAKESIKNQIDPPPNERVVGLIQLEEGLKMGVELFVGKSEGLLLQEIAQNDETALNIGRIGQKQRDLGDLHELVDPLNGLQLAEDLGLDHLVWVAYVSDERNQLFLLQNHL